MHRSHPAAEALPRLQAEDTVPRLRGLLHAHALWIAPIAAVALVAIAPSPGVRVAAAVYGLGLCALFGASAIYHRWWGDPRWKPLLRRVDHSVIFVFIAASYTPIALVVLPSPTDVAVLASVWAGALGGVLLSVLWIDAPRFLVAACYLAVGWVAIAALPQLFAAVGVAAGVLILVGGALYSLGAFAHATGRPNPWPRTFGFHEIFHALVVAAAAVHYVAIAGVVTSPAAS